MKTHETILKIYQDYHRPEYLAIDPLCVARRFMGTKDLEWVALISALFAFGGVKQIIASVEDVLTRLGVNPERPHKNEVFSLDAFKKLNGFRHRIYIGQDVAGLLWLYQNSIQRYGSLKNHFLLHHPADAQTIQGGLSGLIADWREGSKLIPFEVGKSFAHLLNSPDSGSTCKRWVMYLKWMVRADDGLELGLWSGQSSLRTDQLVVPIDTHLFQISKKLKLTKRNTADWKMAIEVTENLKKIDPLDPTRFDFSLCRYGMTGQIKKMQPKNKPLKTKVNAHSK